MTARGDRFLIAERRARLNRLGGRRFQVPRTVRVNRADRAGALTRPVAAAEGMIYEGRVARVHRPGDGLRYPSGVEHRDASELASIVRQLAGKPVTLEHPIGGSVTSNTKIVGRVLSARIDGDHAAASILVTDPAALAAIKAGVRELSLGYDITLDGARYQRNTVVDHLAVVSSARCGSTCSIRADRADCAGTCSCKKESPPMPSRLDSVARAFIDAPTGKLDPADRSAMIEDLLATGRGQPRAGARWDDQDITDNYVASSYTHWMKYAAEHAKRADSVSRRDEVRDQKMVAAVRGDAARYDADGEIRFDSLSASQRVEIDAVARLNIRHLEDQLSETGYEKEFEKARKAVLYQMRNRELAPRGRR